MMIDLKYNTNTKVEPTLVKLGSFPHCFVVNVLFLSQNTYCKATNPPQPPSSSSVPPSREYILTQKKKVYIREVGVSYENIYPDDDIFGTK